ncbi:hypothetical protein BIY24_11870 [Halobacteriovorax marinus]|uniref:hypothetical protein n=1 Tax=Halobacteriovorax marinus TaxID=97084 RepID=UPI000BC3211E|nr:hypothetical protein [Halobacteriovorax marinus]ATH08616.1 hypothetical protein BIY24_11870 [Halobacteriovorax marinus]
MRKLYKDTKRISLLSFFITFISMSLTFANSPEMMVTSVKGNAFLVSKGKTVTLKPGDHIYDFQEVYTEVGGQLTVKNFKDQVFHFAGGSSAKILKGFLELQNGYLWVQSHEKNSDHYKIQTPNSVVSFSEGEAIVDFDNSIVKTQILVLNGNFSFANLFEDYLKLDVSSGKFSFISKEYNNGAPRNPTPVGSNTFTKLQALFDRSEVQKKNIKPVESILTAQDTRMFKSSPSQKKERAIASIVELDKEKSEAEIIYRRDNSAEKSLDGALADYYAKKMQTVNKKKPKVKKVSKYSKKSGVKVYIFGQKKDKAARSIASTKTKTTRKPASIGIEPVVKIKKDAFESSLTREYKKQLRHSKEVNSLINELKSYDQDYKQSY